MLSNGQVCFTNVGKSVPEVEMLTGLI